MPKRYALVLAAPQRADLVKLRDHARQPYLRERAAVLLASMTLGTARSFGAADREAQPAAPVHASGSDRAERRAATDLEAPAP